MQKIILSFILIIYTLAVFGTTPQTSSVANIKSVTVYYSGAEITHTASAILKQGSNEWIVEHIANAIDINSIQIKAPNGVTISGIEFSSNYLPDDKKSPRLQLLQDSLEQLQDNLSRINESISTVEELKELLKSNRDIKGSQTGLNVTELAKIVLYYKTKMQELQDDLLLQQAKKKKTTELISKIKSQINEETTKNILPSGRLTLQVYAAAEGKADFTISYIAKNAAWTPFYDVKVENTKSPVQLIYKARVSQTTGIDWKNVKLSLSTSIPAHFGNAPDLQPWFLGYTSPSYPKDIKIRGMSSLLQGTVAGLQSESPSLEEVVVTGNGTQNDDNSESTTPSEPVYVVDGNIVSKSDFQAIDPNSIKSVEVLKSSAATSLYGSQAAAGAVLVALKNGLEDYVQEKDKTLNLVFNIDIPYDVPSTGKGQTAVIKVSNIQASFRHFCSPSIEDQAYLMANITDWQQQNLLPGEANIIFENTYVGKTFINPDNVKDTLSLTLGDDPRISVKKEKATDFSSTKFLNNNIQQKLIYKITVKNNKNETADVIVNDRYPISTNKDIEVELLESADAQVDKKTGILKWNLHLAPGEIKTIQFGYGVKYPKDKTINL